MAKEESAIVIDWEVIEILGWWRYKVVLSWMDGMSVDVYTSWKMKKNNIRIIPWDVVQVELNPYDMSKGRIIYRSTWWKR
jgi:translation initiation factor IF-1